MSDFKFTSYFGPHIGFNTEGHQIHKHAVTPSGLCVGVLLKAERSGWRGLVQAPYLERKLSAEFRTQDQVSRWMESEISRQHLLQAEKPDHQKYQFFAVRNGCRASHIIEILKVFEEFDANAGYFAEPVEDVGSGLGKADAVPSALMFSAIRMAQRFIPDAIDPEIDSWGIRGRSYLSNNSTAIEAAMASFPKDVTAGEVIYLPLNRLSDIRPAQSTISALHQHYLDQNTVQNAPKA